MGGMIDRQTVIRHKAAGLAQEVAATAKGMERFARACHAFTLTLPDLARREYRSRGCPHGDSNEGLRRWIDENPCWLEKIADGRL